MNATTLLLPDQDDCGLLHFLYPDLPHQCCAICHVRKRLTRVCVDGQHYEVRCIKVTSTTRHDIGFVDIDLDQPLETYL